MIAGYFVGFSIALEAADHAPGGVSGAVPIPPVQRAPLPLLTPASPVPSVPAANSAPPQAPGFWSSMLQRLRDAYPRKAEPMAGGIIGSIIGAALPGVLPDITATAKILEDRLVANPAAKAEAQRQIEEVIS